MFKFDKDNKFVIEAGIVPVIEFHDKSNVYNLEQLPIDSGISPVS